MPSDLTPAEIAELRVLLEKATPPPWEAGAAGHEGIVAYDGEDVTLVLRGGTAANLYLAAAARNKLPRLLDELDRLRTQREHLKRSVTVLWEAVAKGTYDARSLVGDEVLNMKEILFGDSWLVTYRTTSRITGVCANWRTG